MSEAERLAALEAVLANLILRLAHARLVPPDTAREWLAELGMSIDVPEEEK